MDKKGPPTKIALKLTNDLFYASDLEIVGDSKQ